MRFLEKAVKQRSFDGVWELLAKVYDYDNAYTYTNEDGKRKTHMPYKWICIATSLEEIKLNA